MTAGQYPEFARFQLQDHSARYAGLIARAPRSSQPTGGSMTPFPTAAHHAGKYLLRTPIVWDGLEGRGCCRFRVPTRRGEGRGGRTGLRAPATPAHASLRQFVFQLSQALPPSPCQRQVGVPPEVAGESIHIIWLDHEEAIWLSPVGCDLCQELVRRHSGRSGEVQLLTDFRARMARATRVAVGSPVCFP